MVLSPHNAYASPSIDSASECVPGSPDSEDELSSNTVHTKRSAARCLELLREINNARLDEITEIMGPPRLRRHPAEAPLLNMGNEENLVHALRYDRFGYQIRREARIALNERDAATLRADAAQLELFKLRQDLIRIGEGLLGVLGEAGHGASTEMIHGVRNVGYGLIEAGKYGSEGRELRERRKRRLNPYPQPSLLRRYREALSE